MRKPHFAFGLALVVLLLVTACGAEHYDFYNIRKISMNVRERAHAFELARAFVNGEKPPAADLSLYRDVYIDEDRGVFVSAIREDRAALTGFGFGTSIADAVEKAAKNLRRLGANEDLSKLPLRLDIVDESTDEKSRDIAKRWSTDFSLQGLIIDTEPMLALLPDEIRFWRIVDDEGEYSYSQLKKVLTHRGIGRVVRNQIRESEEVEYARFTTISFVEGGSDSTTVLVRGNRHGGAEPTAANIDATLAAAAQYIQQAVKADGQFEFNYDPGRHFVSSAYNERFHAGAIRAMLQLHERTGDAKLLDAAKRGLVWLRDHTRGPRSGDEAGGDWLALAARKMDYAKLGGSGMALMAFAQYTESTGDRSYLPLMEGYGRFLEAMLNDDGSFRTKYYFKGEDDGKYSGAEQYYPGEAVADLAALSRIDGDPHWLELAEKAVDHLVEKRDATLTDVNLPHDLWLLDTIVGLQAVKPNAARVAHAWRMFNGISYRFNDVNAMSDMVGSFYRKPSASGSGRRLAALGLLYRLAETTGDTERLPKLGNMLRKGASYLMHNQFNEYNTVFFPHPAKARGGFMTSYWNPEIQVDSFEYATLALLAALPLVTNAAGAQTP